MNLQLRSCNWEFVLILSALAEKVWIRSIISGYFPRSYFLVVASRMSFIGFVFARGTEVLILEGNIKWRVWQLQLLYRYILFSSRNENYLHFWKNANSVRLSFCLQLGADSDSWGPWEGYRQSLHLCHFQENTIKNSYRHNWNKIKALSIFPVLSQWQQLHFGVKEGIPV